jgi:hypothetical protein
VAQKTKSVNLLDLEKDFDIDFDAEEGYINLSDR